MTVQPETSAGFFESGAASTLSDVVGALAAVSVFGVLSTAEAGSLSAAVVPLIVLSVPMAAWALYVVVQLRARGGVAASLWSRQADRAGGQGSPLARLRTSFTIYRDLAIGCTGAVTALASLTEPGARRVVGVAAVLTTFAALVALADGRRRRRAGSYGLFGEPPEPSAPGWLVRSMGLIATFLTVGIVIVGIGAGFGLSKLIDELRLVPVSSSGAEMVTLPSGQDLLYVGLLGVDDPKPFGPSQVSIVDLSTGMSIEVRFDPTIDKNSPDDVASLGLISFVIPRTGRYEVTIHGPGGLRVWAGTSPGTNVRSLVGWFVVTGIGLAVLAVGVAGLVARVRQRRARSAQAQNRTPRPICLMG